MRTQVSSSTLSTKQILSDVLSLTKPRLSALVIITTAGGMWLAGGTLNIVNGLLVLLGTAMIVGAANTFNCYIERDIDARMTRTANRPLPAGRLDPKIALYFGRLLVFGGLPLVTLWGNPLTGLLAALALLSYVMVYTPMKPRSSASTLIGAFPGALPPLMGWTAVTGRLELPGFILFAILFLWQIPHFLAIALMRQDEYAAAGLKVLPKTAGEKATKGQIFVFTLILLPVSLTLVPMGVMGSVYLVGASILGCGFLWVAVQGFGKNVGYPWARKLFLSSLVYLTLLIAFLILDVLFVGLAS